MEKEDILAISRRENKNRDLAEAEMSAQAGSIASRIGAGTCCFVSVLFVWAANTMLFSPWIIYFSILGTLSICSAILTHRSSLCLNKPQNKKDETEDEHCEIQDGDR